MTIPGNSLRTLKTAKGGSQYVEDRTAQRKQHAHRQDDTLAMVALMNKENMNSVVEC